MTEEKRTVTRALISVSDKLGVKGLAKFLHSMNVEIVSTGGTGKALSDAGIPYTPIEDVTGNPEAFNGRMKTISFQIASGLLFRRDSDEDIEEAKKLGIKPIDMVVCNLYPFAEAKKKGANAEELIENIDIGGPTMIRAAAKNFSAVACVTDPDQYPDLMEEMKSESGALSFQTRRELSVRAFQSSARYETMIAQELTDRFLQEKMAWIELAKGKELRYGENPHQTAVYYRSSVPNSEYLESITGANIIQGKPLSYNNIMDADAAHRSASDAWQANLSAGVAVCVVKHMNHMNLWYGRC